MRTNGNVKHAEKYRNLKKESLAYALGIAEMNLSPDAAKRLVNKNFKSSAAKMSEAENIGKDKLGKSLREKPHYCPRLLKEPGLALEDI